MTKNFRDICGQPAEDFSDKESMLEARSFNESKGINSYNRRTARVKIIIDLMDRDNESKGRADICSKCLSTMLEKTFYTPSVK